MKNNTIFTQKIVYAILTLGCLGSNAFGMRNFDDSHEPSWKQKAKALQAKRSQTLSQFNVYEQFTKLSQDVVPKDKLIACSDYFKHMFSFTDSLHNSQKQQDVFFPFESDTPQEIIDALITYFKTFQTDQHAQAVKKIEQLITSENALYLYDLACRLCIQPIIDLCDQNILNNKHFCVLLNHKNISEQLKELCPTAKQEKIESITSSFKDRLDVYTCNRSDFIIEECRHNPMYWDWKNITPIHCHSPRGHENGMLFYFPNFPQINWIRNIDTNHNIIITPLASNHNELYDLKNDRHIANFYHEGPVKYFAVSSCRNCLITTSLDNTLYIYKFDANNVFRGKYIDNKWYKSFVYLQNFTPDRSSDESVLKCIQQKTLDRSQEK
jgi:hypothetical protein